MEDVLRSGIMLLFTRINLSYRRSCELSSLAIRRKCNVRASTIATDHSKDASTVKYDIDVCRIFKLRKYVFQIKEAAILQCVRNTT